MDTLLFIYMLIIGFIVMMIIAISFGVNKNFEKKSSYVFHTKSTEETESVFPKIISISFGILLCTFGIFGLVKIYTKILDETIFKIFEDNNFLYIIISPIVFCTGIFLIANNIIKIIILKKHSK